MTILFVKVLFCVCRFLTGCLYVVAFLVSFNLKHMRNVSLDIHSLISNLAQLPRGCEMCYTFLHN